MAMTWTKTKNKAAGGCVNVLMVSRNAVTASAAAPRNTLWEGDDCSVIDDQYSVTMGFASVEPYLFGCRSCMSQEPKIRCGGYEGHVGRENML